MSIPVLEAQISAISEDIERQKEVLKKLERSKSLLQGQLNRIRDPIARLPLEISSEFFLRCLSGLDCVQYKPTGFHHTPILFLQICHAWTEIALSTTALWTALHIVLPRSRGFSPVLEGWLERARDQPLDLHVTINAEAADYEGDFDRDITTLIQRRSGRLKSLSIELATQYSSTLGIHFGFTEVLPLLQNLRIHGLMSMLQCPLSPLLELLCHSPNLVELCLQEMNLLPDATEAVVLPHLRRLTLGLNPTDDSESGDHILGCITTPELETLALENMHMILDELIPFLQRSSPPLQKLDLSFLQMQLEGHPLDSELLEQLLDVCPSVTELKIYGPDSEVIERLSVILTRSDPSNILPNLQTFELGMHSNSTFPEPSWNVFLPVILARRTILRTMRICSYSWWPKSVSLDFLMPPTLLPTLKELEAGGMSFWIGTKDGNLFPS